MAGVVAVTILVTIGLAAACRALLENPDTPSAASSLILLLILVGFASTACAFVVPFIGLIIFIVALTRKPISHPVWATVGIAVLAACFFTMNFWGLGFWTDSTGGFFSG